MDFSQLKANVESAMGRNDVPDYVYGLATSAINRDLRLLDMEAQTTLTATGAGVALTLTATGAGVALPADFGSVRSIYTFHGGTRVPLGAITDQMTSIDAQSGAPRFYAIQGSSLKLSPEPDGEYAIELNYFANLPDLIADDATNVVLQRYPDIYLYAALSHAAIWAKDEASERSYGAAYVGGVQQARKDDRRRRYGTAIKSRNTRL